MTVRKVKSQQLCLVVFCLFFLSLFTPINIIIANLLLHFKRSTIVSNQLSLYLKVPSKDPLIGK
jgi:hypothetical protein